MTREGSGTWILRGSVLASPRPATRLLTGARSSRKQSRVFCLCLCPDSSDCR